MRHASDPARALHQGRQLSAPALPLPQRSNLALTVGRAGQVIDMGDWNVVFCSATLADLNLFRRGGQVLFPLYLYRYERRHEH
ncbi:MAG: hypothetical protein OXF83_04590 [Anaerolineaceae bacterium]|nr:hypothetical protein [Anaerolineaceae bacterium]